METRFGTGHFVLAGHVVIDSVIDSKDQILPRESLGGGLSYASICLRSLGHNAEIVTSVGEDFPNQFSEFLSKEGGIDVERWRTPECKTTRYEIDRSLAPRKLRLASKCRDLSVQNFSRYFGSSDHGHVLIADTVAGEITLELLERISKEFDSVFVDSQGFVRAFEYDGRVSMNSGLNISSLSGVDFLKADKDELLAWTGSEGKDDAIRQLSTFVPNILTTSGSETAELYENGELTFRADPLNVEVKDTTGAGDIMLASFAARYVETKNLSDALAFSTAAASLAVRKLAVEKAILSREEILERMKQVKVRG